MQKAQAMEWKKNNELQESGAVSVREIQASESKYFTNLLEMIIAQQELSKLAQEWASFNWETINAFNLDKTKTATQLEIAKDHFEYMLNKQYQVHLLPQEPAFYSRRIKKKMNNRLHTRAPRLNDIR